MHIVWHAVGEHLNHVVAVDTGRVWCPRMQHDPRHTGTRHSLVGKRVVKLGWSVRNPSERVTVRHNNKYHRHLVAAEPCRLVPCSVTEKVFHGCFKRRVCKRWDRRLKRQRLNLLDNLAGGGWAVEALRDIVEVELDRSLCAEGDGGEPDGAFRHVLS